MVYDCVDRRLRICYELLRQLAQEEEQPMLEVLERAIEQYRRDRFLHAANGDFEALQRDPKAWKDELRERALWEQALADGLGEK
jgi:hypothetical protein